MGKSVIGLRKTLKIFEFSKSSMIFKKNDPIFLLIRYIHLTATLQRTEVVDKNVHQ